MIAARIPRADLTVDGEGPVTVESDPRRLERILGNLLENAGRHGAAPIRVVAPRPCQARTVTISDSGRSFPATLLHRGRCRSAPGRPGAAPAAAWVSRSRRRPGRSAPKLQLGAPTAAVPAPCWCWQLALRPRRVSRPSATRTCRCRNPDGREDRAPQRLRPAALRGGPSSAAAPAHTPEGAGQRPAGEGQLNRVKRQRPPDAEAKTFSSSGAA